MSSLNKVTLIGRLGADPKKEFLPDGKQVVKFPLATSEVWKDKGSGEKKEKTEWHNVVIWNEKVGDVAANYLRKGSSVYLAGSMITRKWTDKSAVERYSTEVVLPRFGGELVLLGGKQDSVTSYEINELPAAVGAGISSEEWLNDQIPF